MALCTRFDLRTQACSHERELKEILGTRLEVILDFREVESQKSVKCKLRWLGGRGKMSCDAPVGAVDVVQLQEAIGLKSSSWTSSEEGDEVGTLIVLWGLVRPSRRGRIEYMVIWKLEITRLTKPIWC